MPKASVPNTFEALVDQYDHFVETIVLRISGGRCRPTDLPDLKQAVYLRLWQAWQPGSRSAYDPARGAFTTYLYLIVRSVCINTFQKNSTEPDNAALGLARRARAERRKVGVVWQEDVSSLRDEDFERRTVTENLLAHLRAVAATTEDGTELLQYYDALYRVVPTPHRLAKELGRTAAQVEQTRQKLASVLTRLQQGA